MFRTCIAFSLAGAMMMTTPLAAREKKLAPQVTMPAAKPLTLERIFASPTFPVLSRVRSGSRLMASSSRCCATARMIGTGLIYGRSTLVRAKNECWWTR